MNIGYLQRHVNGILGKAEEAGLDVDFASLGLLVHSTETIENFLDDPMFDPSFEEKEAVFRIALFALCACALRSGVDIEAIATDLTNLASIPSNN